MSQKANAESCSLCQDRGFYYMEGNLAVRCRCARKKKAQAIIPSRFRDKTFANYTPRNESQRLAKNWMEWGRAEGEKGIEDADDFQTSIFLYGSYGAGKTHLLYCQFREMFENGVYAIAKTTYDLIEDVTRAAMDDDFLSEFDECVDRKRQEVHLFWDDADKIKVTDFKMEALYRVIDTIYRNEWKLTVTSNLDLEHLQSVLSPAIVRRIDDICVSLEVK